MTSKNKVVQNALKYAARNDKWIDDFHVIVTADKPDPALVEALKKKSAPCLASRMISGIPSVLTVSPWL